MTSSSDINTDQAQQPSRKEKALGALYHLLDGAYDLAFPIALGAAGVAAVASWVCVVAGFAGAAAVAYIASVITPGFLIAAAVGLSVAVANIAGRGLETYRRAISERTAKVLGRLGSVATVGAALAVGGACGYNAYQERQSELEEAAAEAAAPRAATTFQLTCDSVSAKERGALSAALAEAQQKGEASATLPLPKKGACRMTAL